MHEVQSPVGGAGMAYCSCLLSPVVLPCASTRPELVCTSYGHTVVLVCDGSKKAERRCVEANRYSRLKVAACAGVESDGRLRKRKHASGGELLVVGGYGGGCHSGRVYPPAQKVGARV